MIINWADYEGGSAEDWRLESFLALREEKAFYRTTNAKDGRQALIEIIPTNNVRAEALRASWAAASKLSEAHLLHVHETGETGLHGMLVAYAVVDLPDDDASEILIRSVLNAEEAGRIAVASASGLNYLHKRGLRHGSVTPSNIFFVGDTIKLSVDTIAPADHAGREMDLRQLGTTLVELMTHETEPEAARKLPVPLREAVIGCFESRGREWTAERVLRTVLTKPPGISNRALAAPPLSPQMSDETLGPLASRIVAVRRRWPVALGVAGVCILALIGYMSLYTPDNKRAHAPTRITAPSPAVPATSTLEPPAEPGRAPAGAYAADRQRGRVGSRSTWAVVAATYKTRSAAQNRAKLIESRFPQLHVKVYPLVDGSDRYYVLLGSGLTRDQAEKLRRVVRQLGAPSDTYATKLPVN